MAGDRVEPPPHVDAGHRPPAWDHLRARAATGVKSARTALVDFTPGMIVILAASAFASWACFHQFGAYDLSPLVDVVWRMRTGDRPGVEFINTWPPLLLLAGKAVSALGLGWYALTFANIVATLIAFLAVTTFAPQGRRGPTWTVTVATILVLPLVYTNHIWHSSLSQLAAVVFYDALQRPIRRQTLNVGHGAALFLAAAALAVSKQNVALPILAATLLLVLVAGGAVRWRLAIVTAAGAVGGVVLALAALGMSAEGFLHTFTAVAGRWTPAGGLMSTVLADRSSTLVLGATNAALLVSLGTFVELRRRPSRTEIFAGSFLLLSLLPILTDWDAKLNDVCLPLFVLGDWLMQLPSGGTQEERRAAGRARSLYFLLLGLIAVIALVGGFRRERMARVGQGAFYEEPAGRVVEQGYFSGMRVGDRFMVVLAELAAIKAEKPDARFFFGPRMEFGYRVTGSVSPRGLPLWWHPGSSYALTDEPRVIQAFISNRFDVLVFLKDDRSRLPQALLDHIAAHFRMRTTARELDIYDRGVDP